MIFGLKLWLHCLIHLHRGKEKSRLRNGRWVVTDRWCECGYRPGQR